MEWESLEIFSSKFGLAVQNEAGQRLVEFCQENVLVIANTLFQQHKRHPGAPQVEAGLTRKFETSHVGGATGRTPPIPRSVYIKIR